MRIFLEIWKDRSGGPALAITPLLGSILGGIATTVGTSLLGSLFGGKDKADVSQPATLVPTKPEPDAPVLRQATDRARRRKASAVGRQGTILTSPLGLSDDEDVARPSLLGQ